MHYFTAKYFDKDMKSKIEKTLSKSKPYYVNTKYLGNVQCVEGAYRLSA